jgi:hypothetical protein
MDSPLPLSAKQKLKIPKSRNAIWWKHLERYQISQIVFIVFTVIQIFLFVLVPQSYGYAAHGWEGPPYFSSFRLIGVMEIGLMMIYSTAVYLNDRTVAWLTVFGRSTVLVVIPYLMVAFHGPRHFLLGVVQDICGSLFTGYFLWMDENKQPPRDVLLISNSTALLLPRLAVLVAGILQCIYGVRLYLDPYNFPTLSPAPLFGAPTHLALRMVGYMLVIVGLYEIGISLLRKQDGLMYLTIGVRHLLAYFLTDHVLVLVVGFRFDAPDEHMWLGAVIILTTLIALAVPAASVNIKKSL